MVEQHIAGHSEADQAEQDADGGHGAQQQTREEQNVPIITKESKIEALDYYRPFYSGTLPYVKIVRK